MGPRARIAASLADLRVSGQRLARLNLDLLAAELKQKGSRYALALGLFVAAAVVAGYAVGFAAATITAALALVVPLWLALLIVTTALALLVALLALLGRGCLVRAGSPVPERTLAETRATLQAVRAQVGRAVTVATGESGASYPGEPSGAELRPLGQASPFQPAWRVRPVRPQGVSGGPTDRPASGREPGAHPNGER